jgi:hypothetical protein
LSTSRGIILSVDSAGEIRHNCSTTQGSCGGVLVNDGGDVVGIHFGGGESVNYAFDVNKVVRKDLK